MAEEDEEPFLTSAEVADQFRLNDRTLRSWRKKGMGPPYTKLGGSVLYKASDIRTWIDAQRVVPDKAAGDTK